MSFVAPIRLIFESGAKTATLFSLEETRKMDLLLLCLEKICLQGLEDIPVYSSIFYMARFPRSQLPTPFLLLFLPLVQRLKSVYCGFCVSNFSLMCTTRNEAEFLCPGHYPCIVLTTTRIPPSETSAGAVETTQASLAWPLLRLGNFSADCGLKLAKPA